MINLLLFITLTTCKQLPAHLKFNTCTLKYFSVGDIYVGDMNITNVLESNQSTLIIGTHRECRTCCYQESIFKEIQSTMNIRIARIELADNK